MVLKTVDAHVGGSPLRLLTAGFPSPSGRTMAEKLAWAERHASGLRRTLMDEPRGHSAMCGAVLTEPCVPGAHAGILFMDGDGYRDLSGHGLIAAAAIATVRELLIPGGQGPLVFDTAAGLIQADVGRGAGEQSGTHVAITGCPSFVLHGGAELTVASRVLRADIAFGGAFYALVDSESAGVPLTGRHELELRRTGRAIVDAVNRTRTLTHPLLPHISGLHGVIFTGPSQGAGTDLRTVLVTSGGRVSRGLSGTGLASIMAVFDAMGLSVDGVAPEGLIGTSLRGHVVAKTRVGDYEAIVPAIEGDVWITGDHSFGVADDDPLAQGVRVD